MGYASGLGAVSSAANHVTSTIFNFFAVFGGVLPTSLQQLASIKRLEKCMIGV